jgi:threonine synthase
LKPAASRVQLACPGCGREYDERSPDSVCRECGSLLDLIVGGDWSAAELRATWAGRGRVSRGIESSGVWRYRELVVPTMTNKEIISYPEGNTPLISDGRIAAFTGLDCIEIKHEGMNPTGSFKDRGMTVAMSQAKRAGARAVACASTGNTSASLAAYAALAGLPGVVLIPAGKVSTGKLAQTMAHGATTLSVRGDFDACLTLLREASDALGVYVVNSVNPFRLAGQQTIVFEMLQQLEWKAPDWIVLPAGNLGNTSAFGAALEAARAIGLIDRLPRLAAIQASGAAPFAAAFADGFRSHPTVHPETIATAIRIGAPASWDRAVKAIRGTNGFVTAVTDGEILEAKRTVDEAGIGCEPASAASIAGVRQLAARGIIGKKDSVVAVLTGHVLKDPGIIVERGNGPVEIEATVGALESAISASRSR